MNKKGNVSCIISFKKCLHYNFFVKLCIVIENFCKLNILENIIANKFFEFLALKPVFKMIFVIPIFLNVCSLICLIQIYFLVRF